MFPEILEGDDTIEICEGKFSFSHKSIDVKHCVCGWLSLIFC